MALTFRPTETIRAKLEALKLERGGSFTTVISGLIAEAPLLGSVHAEVVSPTVSPVVSNPVEPKTEVVSPTVSLVVSPTVSKAKPLARASSPSLTKVNSEKEYLGGLGDEGPFDVPLPSDLNHETYITAFNEFLAHRRQKRKKPYTKMGLQKQFSKAAAYARDFGLDKVVECIELTLVNNWEGVHYDHLERATPEMDPFKRYTEEDL